jgi:outer membrane protein
MKNRIILIVTAMALVVTIFMLPRVVVDNKSGNQASDMEASASRVITEHTSGFSDEDAEIIKNLKKNISLPENSEKIPIFADSLAKMYKRYTKPDSAAFYTELAGKSAEETGLQYYEAFTFAVDADKAANLGAQARKFLEAALEANPERLDLKTKIAMTHISTSNPMQGVSLLREVLDQDPNNLDAIFNLGILAIQSKQYDRARDRFKRMTEIDPANENAIFYLAFSYYNLGQDELAKELFGRLVKESKDEEVVAAAKGYLDELR